MNLADLKKQMVDLRRSTYDKERSSPKDGVYVWEKKVYLRNDDYKDDQTRPDWVYRWVAFDADNDFRNFNHWKQSYQAQVVDYKTAEIYPEPLKPTVEGHYRYMDMILMQIPLEAHIDKRLADMKRFDKAREGLQKKFNSDAAKEEAAEGNIVL